MSVLQGFWRFLNTDVREIPWGEVSEKGIEVIAATNDLAEVVKEQAPNLKYLEKVAPFLETLDNPVTQLAISGLPFASIGIGLLRIYLDLSKIEPTYEEAVAIAAQLAYLKSLETVLKGIDDAELQSKLEQVSLKKLIQAQQESLESRGINSYEAKAIANRFPESNLAKKFSEILVEQLRQTEIQRFLCQRLADQVMRGTHIYFYEAIAEAGGNITALAEVYKLGGQPTQERYDSITNYLEKKIKPLPDAQVFDEANPKIQFRDIYVPLTVQPLNQDGSKNKEVAPVNIHDWAFGLLDKIYDENDPRKVMFVEGEAGRGKSVFCRMFSDLVRQELKFSYIPLLIRLRDIRHLESNLTETLEKCPEFEQQDFVCSDGGWLSDPNTRFLIILDGFDELLLEGRASGGLKEFLQQVSDFQERSEHQCIVTGRPLALQGIERLITQTKGLKRVRLEPMSDAQQEKWLANWQKLFRAVEVDKFRAFLAACPKDIADDLAREPLLIYLLARLHREGYLTNEMFEGAEERVQAKIRIYRESVKWVLEKQRQNENFRLSGLEHLEDLREVLQETALCVVQSGNETAQLTMLKDRFQNSENPVASLLKKSQEEIKQSEDKALNNLLTTFYLSPGEGDKRGSVEFAHKSFGEYLFAERLLNAFEAWTEIDKRKRFRMSEGALYWQIYDLLGYGGLSFEIVEYSTELLTESAIDQVRLFERLHEFYLLWCDGEFLDQEPSDNCPQKKMLQLRKYEIETGLKQIDIYTGLNVMILLFRLHAAAQPNNYPHLMEDEPTPEIRFHPCGETNTKSFDRTRLQKIIYYADSLGIGALSKQVGKHLYNANLSYANLANANLSNANLSCANLSNAFLHKANFSNANFSNANLSYANLSYANFSNANFSNANLSYVYFNDALVSNTNLKNANLSYAFLSNANIKDANFSYAFLHKARLSNANLSDANFSYANLSDANFSYANLSYTNFSYANLSYTNFSYANLYNANLSSSILLETDCQHVQHLTSRQLNDENTPALICGALLPEGLKIDSNRDWGRLAQALYKRGELEIFEDAKKWVNERRPQ